MIKETGGPAFPCGGQTFAPEAGMTLRDYFAAAALQGFMANPETGDNAIAIVRASYKIAEAMLKEREEC